MQPIAKVTIVIVERQPNALLVVCGSCQGKGRYLNDDRNKCGVCDGIGRVSLRIPEDWAGDDVGVVSCGSCRGKGRYLNDDRNKCGPCSGVGVAVKKFPRVACGSCNGHGRYLNEDRNSCEACAGIGSVFVGNLKAY